VQDFSIPAKKKNILYNIFLKVFDALHTKNKITQLKISELALNTNTKKCRIVF